MSCNQRKPRSRACFDKLFRVSDRPATTSEVPLSKERVWVLKGKSVSSIIDLLKSSERLSLTFLSKRNNGIRWRLKKENLISSFVKLATRLSIQPNGCRSEWKVVKKIAAFVAISRNNKIYCFECFQSAARSETGGTLFPFATKALIYCNWIDCLSLQLQTPFASANAVPVKTW